jgi:hypothetical protein
VDPSFFEALADCPGHDLSGFDEATLGKLVAQIQARVTVPPKVERRSGSAGVAEHFSLFRYALQSAPPNG